MPLEINTLTEIMSSKQTGRPLKVLHILDHSLPLHSGYAFRSQNIFRAQLKKGWQPVILTSSKHEENWKGRSQKEEEIGGFRYYRSGSVATKGCPLESEVRIMASLNRSIRQAVLREKVDLLHAHSPILTALPALWVGRTLKIPVVYEVRALWEDGAVDHGTYGQDSWKYRLVRSLETWVCDRANQVVVLCNGLKGDLVERGLPSQKVTVVPNGVNVEDFKVCKPDSEYKAAWNLGGRKVIGFIGSFYRYEGLDLLLDAMARLTTHKSNIVLLLVGGGEVEAELKQQIKQLRLEGKVVMPGRIPHERMPGIYSLIDILVYPRHSARVTELVTPLKPLESMAMGRVVVASDVGGHRELVQDGVTGLFFPAGDVAALTEILVRALDDSELRRRLEENGMSWVRKERTWDKTTAAYESVYAKALGNKDVIAAGVGCDAVES